MARNNYITTGPKGAASGRKTDTSRFMDQKQGNHQHGKVFRDVSLPNGQKLSTMREDVFRAAVDATRKR